MDSRVVLGSTGPPITPQVDVEQKIGRRGVGVALRLKDKKKVHDYNKGKYIDSIGLFVFSIDHTQPYL